MRICSFLPAATEIVFALGLGDSLMGVTFECNYPPEAKTKPAVIHSRLPQGLPAGEIDRCVSEFVSRGESIYRVDADQLHEIRPDLIIAQDLCHVCAASPNDFATILAGMSPTPAVLTLSPKRLADVWNDILLVGRATGRTRQAMELVDQLQDRLEAVKCAAVKASRPRVLCLEWLDPPYVGGHWIPEMVELAGGIDVLGKIGQPGFRVTWEAVLEAAPEVVVVMPCGYDEKQARAELAQFPFPYGWTDLPAVRQRRVFAVDAHSYFSCPGPRLVDGLELLMRFLCTPAASDGSPSEPRQACRNHVVSGGIILHF
jgi:iron complex transport system substrate-binding protein